MCDAMVDLHSGGKTLDYLPSALVRRPPGDDPNAAAKRAALEAFRAPIGYVVSDAREDGRSPRRPTGWGSSASAPSSAAPAR